MKEYTLKLSRTDVKILLRTLDAIKMQITGEKGCGGLVRSLVKEFKEGEVSVDEIITKLFKSLEDDK
ncbi:hypothetical protein KAU11_09090 [Candidatus Babeliales bacterium]|nr:hypothetical protein [Candidatus Babeliales bacterium]